MEIPPLKTFICYAREDRKAVDELRKHLALLEKKQVLEVWYDGEILAGENWDKSIKKRLEQAEIVLMFISVDFINSEYIEKTELQAALQRHRDGLARLIPVIVHPCDWGEYFEMGQFQALPNQARPIFSSHFAYAQEAFHEIQQGIKRTAQDMQERRIAELKVLAESADRDRREEEARLAREQEEASRAAVEKNRAERLRNLDNTAWQTALAEVESADNERDKIIALETYLDEPSHTLHRKEAETRLAEIKAADTKRRIEEKKRLEAQRQAAEEKRKKTEEEKRKREAALAAKQAATLAPYLPEMILIKGGSFDMGDTFGDKVNDDEKPVHKVTVGDFYLGKYAVTVAQFKAFIDDSGYTTDADKNGGSYIWNGAEWVITKNVNWRCDVNGKVRPDSEQNHPVIHVSWNDAQACADWLSTLTGRQYRLPTEAEWEYAARAVASPSGEGKGGGKVRFGNGKNMADPKEINFDGSDAYKRDYSRAGEYRQKTVPVDSFQPNALGLYQMSGNVWEWCEDWYHSNYDGAPSDGSAWLSPAGSYRVLRGGSWNYNPQYVRAAYRGHVTPGDRFNFIGFRLARTK